MMSISERIYRAAGSPSGEGVAAGDCKACGINGYGVQFVDWVRPTFTDHDKLFSGTIICHSCLFCFEDQGNEALRLATGKDGPQKMRNYSHFVLDGKWLPLSKGAKPKMRELLIQSPEVAVIADSGQKHIIFRARPGWWQFEEYRIAPSAFVFPLIETCTEMLAVFSKAEIESGQYIHSRIGQFGIARWREAETIIKQHRGSILFALAIYLSQKEEDDGTPSTGGQTAVPVLASNRKRVQAKVCNDNLEPVRGGDQGQFVY